MVSRIILKIALIICLSSQLMGCFTNQLISTQATFTIPSKPKLAPVSFVHQNNGFFMGEQSAANLANNIDEMKAYQQKLELLVNTMAKFYKTKLEEQKVEGK